MLVFVDYAMCEYCAQELLNAFENNLPVDKALKDNFLKSCSSLVTAHIKPGPKFFELWRFVNAKYLYEDHPKGFDLGAVTGALEFYKSCMELE